MGMGGEVLFAKEDFVSGEEIVEQLSRENNDFSFHLGSIHETDYGKYPTGKHVAGNIISNSDKTDQLVMYINYELDEYMDCWDKNLYYTSIYIEDVAHGKKILLPFLLYILRLYPKAKVWIDYDWFYTLADLEQVAARLGRFDSWHEVKNPTLEDLQRPITDGPRNKIWYAANPKEFYL
jgi:hypothetical protein